MPLEAKLYKPIEKFAKSEFDCHAVKSQIGTKLGKVDVVGVREFHGDLETHNEIVAIEVKEENASFLSSAGQARAYAIYAHKCYLAVRKRRNAEFSQEEKDIAAQLGIGLIEIRDKGCKTVATSSAFTPRDANVLNILNKLGMFQCTLCHAAYPVKDIANINPTNNILEDGNLLKVGGLKKAIGNRKNAVYFLYQLYHRRKSDGRQYIYDRRYICKDCASIFASLIDWK